MRREFPLPEEDTEYLDSTGLPWEAIISNGNWVIIHSYPVPAGYTVKETSVALRIDSGYPVAQIDMAYFFPWLKREDNKVIGALAIMQIEQQQWQRWSRHRTGNNPWRSELDGIGTHMGLVQYWLEREFTIR